MGIKFPVIVDDKQKIFCDYRSDAILVWNELRNELAHIRRNLTPTGKVVLRERFQNHRRPPPNDLENC
jgi:hypothetical protein